MKKHRKTILYCPHFINRIREKTFLGHMEWAGQYITELQTTALIHAAEAKPWDVWIKPHSDEGGAWKQFLSQFDQTQIRLLPFSSDISQLISCCDVLVTTFSTAAIEGRVAGKPVVSLNLTGLQDRHPYVEQKLVYAAKTESELRKTLEIILDQEKSDLCQPAFFLGRLKDGSAECVVEWILEETEMDVQINP